MPRTSFGELLTDSVRLRLRSDVPVGSCLSGGLDSSSIVCLMHDLLRQQGQASGQHTFSSHFEEKEANELEYMREVIEVTSVEPHFIHPGPDDLLQDLSRLIWHQEEPFGSTSIFAQWSVFKLVHENGIKVMLDGRALTKMLGRRHSVVCYYFRNCSISAITHALDGKSIGTHACTESPSRPCCRMLLVRDFGEFRSSNRRATRRQRWIG